MDNYFPSAKKRSKTKVGLRYEDFQSNNNNHHNSPNATTNAGAGRPQQQQQQRQGQSQGQHLSSYQSYNNMTNNMTEQPAKKERKPSDIKITELLAINFATAIGASADITPTQTTATDSKPLKMPPKQPVQPVKYPPKQTKEPARKMEGDIDALSLRNEFFMGVKLGWPFPEMLKPQRLMGLHIIKALQNRKHVVLESPTGTGKSAAILCSVLGWQRHHYATTGEKVKIIYTSRTHSQVAQMVSSLQKTPYRPTMTVLASRDRLCIHEKVTDNGNGSNNNGNNSKTFKKTNVNMECRSRVKNTEGSRKFLLDSKTSMVQYDDENPPEYRESDDLEGAAAVGSSSQGPEGEDDKDSSDKPTCQHYRQLGAGRTAGSMAKTFRPASSSSSSSNQYSNGTGDESTKDGTHDIEDMIQFGKNPYKRTVVLRKSPQESWGMACSLVPSARPHDHRVIVDLVTLGGQAAKSGTVQPGDMIFSINHRTTQSRSLDDIAEQMIHSNEKLVLTVGSSGEEQSAHSACPYYMSRVLEKHAELVFCPYNYVLDPEIRKSLGIGLDNTVVVLDEAHNVEDVLRGAGSGVWGEFELCGMIAALQYFAGATVGPLAEMTVDIKNPDKQNGRRGDPVGEGAEMVQVNEVAHELMVFLERLVLFMFDSKSNFEQSGGAKKAIEEWERFHTPDSKSFEMTYDGPSGYGLAGKSVGCKTFFEKVKVDIANSEKLRRCAETMEMLGREQKDPKYATIFEKMVDVVSKVTLAMEEPQSYFIQSTVKANGSLSFAAGAGAGGSEQRLVSQGRFQQKPKPLPFAPGRTASQPNNQVDACRLCKDNSCAHELNFNNGKIRHGSFNNGAIPPWEAFLVLDLLTPARNMSELADRCRTVILASGSLAPLPSLCAELGLRASHVTSNEENNPLSAAKPTKNEASAKVAANPTKAEESVKKSVGKGRLQDRPAPLEADHVINLEKQLMAVAIGHFPDGSSLTVNYNQYKHDSFLIKLGDAIATVIEAIPRGGVLVFLSSYALLKRCTKAWNPESNYDQFARAGNHDDTNAWNRMLESKGKIIVEPTGGQADFEAAKSEYAEAIRVTGSCVLFAVFRGKMSEGISFNDDNARGVICVGIPFPSSFDRSIKAKKSYNDEQRKLEKCLDLLPGDSWYSQQAYRAIAQALGRCIRHAGDYGTIVLMDSRHCDESPPDQHGTCNAHRQLPKWMRSHVQTLTPSSVPTSYGKTIAGSWPGLKAAYKYFFEEAPVYAEGVLQKQRESLQRAQEQAAGSKNAASLDVKPSVTPMRSTHDPLTTTPQSITPSQALLSGKTSDRKSNAQEWNVYGHEDRNLPR